jgi:hypothetical protein
MQNISVWSTVPKLQELSINSPVSPKSRLEDSLNPEGINRRYGNRIVYSGFTRTREFIESS